MIISANCKNKEERIRKFLADTEQRIQKNDIVTYICVDENRKQLKQGRSKLISYSLFTNCEDISWTGTHVICVAGEYINGYPYSYNDHLLSREDVIREILDIME